MKLLQPTEGKYKLPNKLNNSRKAQISELELQAIYGNKNLTKSSTRIAAMKQRKRLS